MFKQKTSAKIAKIDPNNPDQKLIKQAADILRNGGLVIIPTETVYGIAANAKNKAAMQRLNSIKERPDHKPFTLHIHAKDRIEEFVKDISPAAYRLMDKFWPGPLTLIFNSTGTGTIGIRLPDEVIARAVIAQSGVAVVCPSANLAGKNAPVNFEEAIAELKDKVDFAIDAQETKYKKESTVVDATSQRVKVLREGAIKNEEILRVAQRKTVLFVCTGNSCRSVMAEGLLRKKTQDMGRFDIDVLSAGIMSQGGLPASFETLELLKRHDINASSHRSRPVTKELLDKSDLVLVMEDMHEQRILQSYPQVSTRMFLLKEFAKTDSTNLNIPDPIGRDAAFYEYTFAVIKEAVDKVAQVI
jgi:tRNA threonylcarbamoyl adenosine modification protein (Sua5/YciO/YrdC/YwlC family)